MSAVPRDPLFWKRFSVALHQVDPETGKVEKQSDDWLARQNAKKSRRGCVCCAFWLCFFIFVAAVIAVVIWLLKSGVLHNFKLGNGDGTPNQLANPNGGNM